jgi:hypothetical protein
MAILERVEPIGLRWSPTTTAPPAYLGRHRHDRRRRVSLLAFFYLAAHTYAATQGRYLPRHARTLVQPVRYVARHRRLG